MAFSDEKGKAGKRFVQMVDVELDFCQEVYGTAPCAAVLGSTSTRKCFNTFETCQDTANYNPAAKTYRFIQPRAGLPRSINAYPVLDSIEMAPTRLDPGNSLGKRASVTVRLNDAPHHDRGIDKYVDERISGDAMSGVALSFDGDDDYVTVPDDAALNFTGSENVTVEFWVRHNDEEAFTDKTIISKGHPTGSGAPGWRIYWSTAGRPVFVLSDGSTIETVTPPSGSWSDGKWHHVAATNDGAFNMQIYVDGVFQDGNTHSIGDSTNTDPLYMAREFGSSTYWSGELTDVRIWNELRSTSEIADNKDARLAGTETNLVAYYKLNDNTGTTAADSTSNANDGTLTNGPEWVEDGPIPDESKTGKGYEPYDRGTFFGKLRARNPFYLGRKLHVYTGYIPWNHDQPPDRQIQLDQTVTTAQDATTNANDGTLTNGPTWVSDGPNSNIRGALSFDGVDDNVTIPNPYGAARTTATIEGWAKIDDASAHVFFSGGFGDTVYPRCGVNSSNQSVFVQANLDGSLVTATSAADGVTVGQWHHIAVVFDVNAAKTMILYIDGVEAASNSTAGTSFDGGASDLLLGEQAGLSAVQFFGLETDWGAWSTARTQQQIQNNMNTRLNGDETGLVGYWKLTDGLTGFTEQDLLDHLQKRTYVMERWEGPDSRGNFRIVAKDILKLADDDRAQAPKPSNGRLDASITAGASAATLTPSGIGDEEYPASGRAKIGDEIVEFTRSSDSLTLDTRGDLNTEAEAHDQGDTVQLIYEQEGAKSSAIVEDLLTNFASIDGSFIDSTAWTDEDDTYIGRLFTGYVVEPTPVVDLVNELSRQAGFFIWWDELNQQIPFKAIRQPETVTINLADDDAFLEGTIRQKEQPDKRVSQVWVYHGLLTPTDDIDKAKNYATIYVLTESAKEETNAYGRPSIRKVFARWISQTNRAAAEDVAKRLMSRFQDPPRRLEYTLPGARSEVETGDLFNATTRLIQDVTGLSDRRRMLALSKEETKDGQYRIDAEEFLFVQTDDEGVKRVVITANVNDFKARDEFDLIYASVESGDEVEFEIESGVIVGASSTSGPAWDMQSWPSGVTITVVVNGRIQGKGGDAGTDVTNDPDGESGGDAFFTRQAITVENNGEIWSGGGGGGTAIQNDGSGNTALAGGGGGAGKEVGEHSNFADTSIDGEDGTTEVGGDGGSDTEGGATANGGDGGDPGQDGGDGSGSGGGGSTFGSGGSAGTAIDGDSFVTYDTIGDIRGAQTN